MLTLPWRKGPATATVHSGTATTRRAAATEQTGARTHAHAPTTLRGRLLAATIAALAGATQHSRSRARRSRTRPRQPGDKRTGDPCRRTTRRSSTVSTGPTRGTTTRERPGRPLRALDERRLPHRVPHVRGGSFQGFRKDLGANTVRMPVKPVLGRHRLVELLVQGAIDAARHEGFRVVLVYWEGDGASKEDGKVDDPAAWTGMWDTLTRTYARDRGVYFEPMNEPSGTPRRPVDPGRHRLGRPLHRARHPARPRVRQRRRLQRPRRRGLRRPGTRGTYVSRSTTTGIWGTHDAPGGPPTFTSRLGDQACSARNRPGTSSASPMTTGIDYRGSATTGDADADNSVAFSRR